VLTVIGTPPLAFSGNFESVVFLPQYFRDEMFTAYELMRRRFGERIRRLTAGTLSLCSNRLTQAERNSPLPA